MYMKHLSSADKTLIVKLFDDKLLQKFSFVERKLTFVKNIQKLMINKILNYIRQIRIGFNTRLSRLLLNINGLFTHIFIFKKLLKKYLNSRDVLNNIKLTILLNIF